MYVLKRDGRQEPVMFDKITARVRKLCTMLDKNWNPESFLERLGIIDG